MVRLTNGRSLPQHKITTEREKTDLVPSAGFPTIVISMLFLGHMQIICLGILGGYIRRTGEELKSRA